MVAMLSVVALTAMLNAWVAVCGVVELSLTVTVKLDVPAAVGDPEITPLEGSRLRPAGREPDVMDHV